MKIPIIEGYRATNVRIAFFLASLATALSAVSAIEVRAQLENKDSRLYRFVDRLTPGDRVPWLAIVIPVFLTAFLSNILALNILHILFGYGSAFIIDDKFKHKLPKY
jgi:hypothetical protein